MAFSVTTSLGICLGIWISLYLVSAHRVVTMNPAFVNEDECTKGFDVLTSQDIQELKAFLQERRDAPLKAACHEVCALCFPGPHMWPDFDGEERNRNRRQCEDECFLKGGVDHIKRTRKCNWNPPRPI